MKQTLEQLPFTYQWLYLRMAQTTFYSMGPRGCKGYQVVRHFKTLFADHLSKYGSSSNEGSTPVSPNFLLLY